MSKKIRCGHNFGIDLTQVLFWKRIPKYKREGELLGQVEIEDGNLELYISGETIMIRKKVPNEVINIIQDEVILEEEDFGKLLEYLAEEFPCNLSER
jgi:hypothetical protein